MRFGEKCRKIGKCRKKEDKQEKCEDLRKVVEDVVGFGDGEFLTDLSLTLVNSLKTLASTKLSWISRSRHDLFGVLCQMPHSVARSVVQYIRVASFSKKSDTQACHS